MHPMIAFTILVSIFAVGEFISVKTKAILSAMLVGGVILLGGYWLGLSPDIMNISGINQMAPVFIGLLITSMGTLIDFDELLRQYKTVIIGLSAAIFIVIVIILVGPVFIDKNQAIASSSIVAGGVVANLIIQESIAGKGLIDIELICMLVLAIQSLIGIPITSMILRREAKRYIISGDYKRVNFLVENNKINNKKKFIKEIPEKYNKPIVILAKIGIVMSIAELISRATNGVVNTLLLCMLLGVVATSIGFLEKDALTKANSFGMVMAIITIYVFGSIYQATPEIILNLMYPMCIIFVLGIIGIIISALIMSKIFRISFLMCCAIGLTALFGFPATYYIPNEVAEAVGKSEEEINAIKAYMLPKMLTAGFATVTIGSVIVVGFVVKMI